MMLNRRSIILALCLMGLLAVVSGGMSALALVSCGMSALKPIARRTAFDNAVVFGDVRTARAMLDAGEPVNGDPSEYEYMPPLQAAAGQGHDGVVRLLLDRGADIHCESGWGTPLGDAARAGHLSTVKLLIQRGVLDRDRKYRQDELDYALWVAAVDGRLPVVRYLLAQGADPNQASEGAGTLLEACKTFGRTPVVAVLEQAAAREKPHQGRVPQTRGNR